MSRKLVASPISTIPSGDLSPIEWRIPRCDARCNSSGELLPAQFSTVFRSSREMLTTDFSVTVVSPSFAGVSSIKRHRQVNALFKEEFALPHGVGLHALSLKTKTPEEWEKETGEKL